MAEFTRDASEYGQLQIVQALQGIAASTATDTALTDANKAANAKAVGDAIDDVEELIGSVAADGNYIKKSETKDVCENLGLLDAKVKENTTQVATNASNIGELQGLISDDGTTKMLFGMVVTISDQGAITLTAPTP